MHLTFFLNTVNLTECPCISKKLTSNYDVKMPFKILTKQIDDPLCVLIDEEGCNNSTKPNKNEAFLEENVEEHKNEECEIKKKLREFMNEYFKKEHSELLLNMFLDAENKHYNALEKGDSLLSELKQILEDNNLLEQYSEKYLEFAEELSNSLDNELFVNIREILVELYECYNGKVIEN